MKKERLLHMPIGSEGEKYFREELMPVCKDNVVLHWGYYVEETGEPLITYEISDSDYYRIRNYIRKRDRLANA